MDESDLFRTLSTPPARFLKQSNVPESSALDFTKQMFLKYRPELGGAGALAVASMLSGIKGKSGKTFFQSKSHPSHEASEVEREAYRRANIDPGFAKKLKFTGARLSKDLSDLMAEHPVASALTFAAPIGWQAGGTVSRFLKAHPELIEKVKNTLRR